MNTQPRVPGIWFEKNRNRWRVKIVRNKAILHRSYHSSYEEAYEVWLEVKKEIRQSTPLCIKGRELTVIERFLYQPTPK